MLKISVVVLALVALLTGCAATKPYAFQGMTADPPKQAPEIALNDQHGQPFRLSEQGGKIVMLYFGFTHCPDLCPTTLSDFKAVKQQLGGDADRVRFVLLTVDPQRDTPEVMQQYLGAFDSEFIGLTPTTDELKLIAEKYSVKVEYEIPDANGNYQVGHTSLTYLIDRSGQVRVAYPTGSGFPAKSMTADVKYLLSNP